MASQKTITINGRVYDAVTGLPVDTKSAASSAPAQVEKKAAAPVATKTVTKEPAAPHVQTAAATVHSNVQRSKTLNRRAAKKPATPPKVITRATTARHMDIARNPSVAKFAQHPVAKPAPVKPASEATHDRPAQIHPTAQKAIARSAAKRAHAPAKPTTAKQVKEAAISNALSTPKPKEAPKKKGGPKNRVLLRRSLIIGAIVLVIAGILFAVYRLVPSISVSIASAQAGISASYPEYTPDGFTLSQPVTYSDGQVDLTFNSTSNDNYYTITQTRSSWDSSAVLDNVVEPAVDANYITTRERGLTIYTFDESAAWVNGGILYQIDSKAPLSGDQIRRIATSL